MNNTSSSDSFFLLSDHGNLIAFDSLQSSCPLPSFLRSLSPRLTAKTNTPSRGSTLLTVHEAYSKDFIVDLVGKWVTQK